MSRLAIAISRQTIWATGDVRLWADIDLWLKDATGNFVPETFRIDTATDVTTFPAYLARQFGLALAANPTAGIRHNQTALEIRSGVLRFCIDGLDQTEYAVACFFLGDPDMIPDAAQPATFPSKLLQPFALLDRLRFAVDKDPTSAAIYGEFVVEKR